MTAKRAAVYCGGGLLILAGFSFAGALGRQTPPVTDPSHAVETSGTVNLGTQVQEQTARLKSRLAEAPRATEPVRNPFMFAPRESGRRTARAAETAVPEPVAPAPAEPAIELVGLAENRTKDGIVRTAIVSSLSGDLYLVKEGDSIVDRYKVKAVGADTVELTDLVTGGIRRLALRQ